MPEPLPPEQARALAQEILARPEYATYRRDPTVLQRWVDDVAAWLRAAADSVESWMPEWLLAAWDSFWAGLRGTVSALFGEDALVVLGRIVVAALVLGAFGLLVRRIVRELRQHTDDGEASEPVALSSGPRLIEEADRLATAGRFLEAAHCTQLASLQVLLDKDCLELERSDPNRTLRRRLREAPMPGTVRDRFLELLDRLESEWFRDRHQDRGLYGDWRALHREIQSLPAAR